MKFGLKWHKEREEQELRIRIDKLERIKLDIQFRERQIAEAERRGLDSFDADRLLVKRKATTA